MRAQKGFTLIELVMVIVILGILSAIALPKFVDLTGKAAGASVTGVAGAVSSASAINYAAYKAGVSGYTAVNTATVDSSVLGAMMTGGWPTGFTVSGGSCASAATNTLVTVNNVQGGTTYSANAVVYCTN